MATGDILQLEVLGTVTDDSGNSPEINGFVARILIEGMGRRTPFITGGDPKTVATSLSITVQDPGYEGSGSSVTRTRTIRGIQPLHNTYPRTWTSIGSGGTVAAGSWCCNGTLNNNLYYTAAGGTRGGTAPTHVTSPAIQADLAGTSVSDGGVMWQAWGAGTFPGFVEKTSGGNVWVYLVLDGPIYQGSTITAASIDANAYSVSGTNSRAAASIPTLTNSSTLQYEIPIVTVVTIPHFLARSAFRFEVAAEHPYGQEGRSVACVRMQAWDAARSTGSSVVTVAATSLSTQVGKGNALSPNQKTALEVYGGTIDATGLAAGDSFVEFEVYPFLGNRLFRSRFDGDGANWIGSTAYAAGQVVRNGGNFYFCATAGTSASSGGPTGTGTSITDGSAVWNYFGNDDTKHNGPNPPARLHFWNDPASLYKQGHAHVNATGANAGTPAVYATYAASKAAADAGSSYGTHQLANVALATYHNTPGGGLTTHNDSGGGTIWAMAGTHPGMSASTSMNTPAPGKVWTYCRADPAEPPNTVIMGLGGTQVLKAPAKRMWLSGYTMTIAGSTGQIDAAEPTAVGQIVNECVIEYCDITGTNNTSRALTRIGSVWARNNTYRTAGNAGAMTGRTNYVDFMGNRVICAVTSPQLFITAVSNTMANDIVGYDSVSDAQTRVNVHTMFVNVSANYVGGGTSSGMVKLFGGSPPNPTLGGAVVSNIVEPYGANSSRPFNIGADTSTGDMRNVVISYNTAPGWRTNIGYNDQAAAPIRSQWYVFNNVFALINVVFDGSNHAGSSKGTGRFQNYWCAFAVGWRDNVFFAGSNGVAGFNFFSYGLSAGKNSLFNTVPSAATQRAQFVSDLSSNETDSGTGAGGGDYRPASGAVALGRVTVSARSFGADGTVRQIASVGAIGAYEASGTFLTFAGGAIGVAGSWALSPSLSLEWNSGAIGMAGAWAVSVAPPIFTGPRRFVSSGLRGSQLSTPAGRVIR